MTMANTHEPDLSDLDIEFHEKTARSYDEHVTKVYRIYHREVLHPFLDRVRREAPKLHALDIGCGTGVVSIDLAERGFEVSAVDHSPAMIALAARKARERGFARQCRFELADVRTLPFRDHEFDLVTCQGVLHHLEELQQCVGEIARVLRASGFFYISEPSSDETIVSRAWRRWIGFAHAVREALPVKKSRLERPSLAPGERPIAPRLLFDELDRHGFTYTAEYLTHLALLERYVPDGIRLALTRLVSSRWRGTKGDLLFVYGQKL
jgi:ubiquinone/menaquinone biosynthesis C-methylase UbiE